MNVSPQSENKGNVVRISAASDDSNVRIANVKNSYGTNSNDDADDDEEFMTLMNEGKKREDSTPPFRGSAGLPGGYHRMDESSNFRAPAESDTRGESPALGEQHLPQSFSSQPAESTSVFRSLEEEKQHYLFRIQRLQSRFPGGRRVGLDTGLEDLKYEYDRLKRQSETTASIKFQRRTLMATVSGIEYLNKSFNPLGLHLDGWSEQVMDSLEDFDQTFEQLHEKYQGTSEVSPEWNLMIMLLGSGFMFHLSNSLFKSVLPNVNDVAKNNPDLMNQIASAMGSAMNQQNQQNSSPQTSGTGGNSSQLGASLAMKAMQQKLRPQESIQEYDDIGSSVTADDPPPGFEQASALLKPLPPMARPVSINKKEPLHEDTFSEGGSDLSSELSISEDEVRHVAEPKPKRSQTQSKKSNKKSKNSLDINI